MRGPTNDEQLLLEYANLLRQDPLSILDLIEGAKGTTSAQDIADAISYFGVDMDIFRSQMDSFTAQSPLAWNSALAKAADGHNQAMIAHDTQSHQLPGEAKLSERIVAAGYEGWRSVGENVYAFAEDPLHAHAGFVIDWGYDAEDTRPDGYLRPDWNVTGDGMQDPAGHREILLSGKYHEIGISILDEGDSKTSVGPFVVTQNFATRSGYVAQLMGVVIDDLDKDAFYDIGEGLAGIRVEVKGADSYFTTSTWTSGGYQLELAAGSYEVTFSGGALAGVITKQVTMGTENLKLDAMAAEAAPSQPPVTPPIEPQPPKAEPVTPAPEVPTPVTPTPVTPEPVMPTPVTPTPVVPQDHGLPFATGLQKNPGDLTLSGKAGADLLQGHLGDDYLYGDGNRAAWAPIETTTQVYRLYQAILGRVPDPSGLLTWTKALTMGSHTVESATQGFMASPEFQKTYGLLDTNGFVQMLYQNVLGRSPDAVGLRNWTTALDSGMTREKVVLGFANSIEFTNKTAQPALAYAQGTNEGTWSDDVFRLYKAAFDRAPDLAGFTAWSTKLAAGLSAEAVGQGFAESREFIKTYGALDDQAFLHQLYANVLGRAPDASGMATWTAAMEGGLSRGMVLWGFAQSREFAKSSAPEVKAWMLEQGGGDTLIGGGGDDHLFGGAMSDTFVFHAQGDGNKVIHDFEAWDHLAFQDFGYQSVDDLREHLFTQGSSVIFEDQGVKVEILETKISTLTDDVFLI